MTKLIEMWLEIAADEQLEGDSSGAESTEVSTPEGEVGIEQTEEVSDASAEPEGFEIDGERLTAEQIKEFRKGYMRQADYTRKTTSVAQERKENAEALELYNFLRDNPDIAKQLAELAPEKAGTAKQIANPELQDIKLQLTTMEIDKTLESIRAKDPDADEVAILNLAIEEGITVDKAYKQWKGENFDTILKRKLEEQSKNITETMKKTKEQTKTLITPKTKQIDNFGLSAAQVEMAGKLDMSLEEYKRWST